MEENEQVVIIANRLLDLKKLCLREDPYFNRLYQGHEKRANLLCS